MLGSQGAAPFTFMIQTKHDTIFICEIKFSRKEIGKDIIEELKEKIKKLVLPKHISRRPVLIHVNGVKDDINFTKKIDLCEMLEVR